MFAQGLRGRCLQRGACVCSARAAQGPAMRTVLGSSQGLGAVKRAGIAAGSPQPAGSGRAEHPARLESRLCLPPHSLLSPLQAFCPLRVRRARQNQAFSLEQLDSSQGRFSSLKKKEEFFGLKMWELLGGGRRSSATASPSLTPVFVQGGAEPWEQGGSG